MIQYRGHGRNVYEDKNLYFMDDWYAEDCIDAPLEFHMRQYFYLK